MPITCFLLTPTDRAEYWLHSRTLVGCTSEFGHRGRVRIEDGPLVQDASGVIQLLPHPDDALRWPTRCEICSELLPDHGITRSLWQEPIYMTPDGQAVTVASRSAPPGAMWAQRRGLGDRWSCELGWRLDSHGRPATDHRAAEYLGQPLSRLADRWSAF
jgi:hypothetical protein